VGPGGHPDGQRWLACAIVPTGNAYPGSIRDEENRGAADAFGQCRSLSAPGPKRVPCSEPHEIEIFGTALGELTDADAQNGSCASLLTAVTRLPDPTAGGQLEVQIVPDRLLGRRNCEVQVLGDRLLHESLLGWGLEPLPFG
jgi:hypothetical protein